MASVFATQSLLQAVGIGARRSLPAAATINWVLKDGLGRLGRLTVATRWGESFDADLKVSRAGTRARAIADCKTLCADRRRLADPFSLPPPPLFAPPQRFRYTTSLLYCVALGLEYLTPLFPQHFLPLASVGERERTAGVGHALGVHQAAPGCRRHCTPPPRAPPSRAPTPPASEHWQEHWADYVHRDATCVPPLVCLPREPGGHLSQGAGGASGRRVEGGGRRWCN